MMNTTTMLAHIKGSARDFLYPFQDKKEAQKVRYEGEISWGVSSTIITDSLHLRFLPTDSFFTPYSLIINKFTVYIITTGLYLQYLTEHIHKIKQAFRFDLF
jgi:hypothetical protein